MADDVAAFIQQHQLPASTIIGHSMQVANPSIQYDLPRLT
jgi:hypothetical protein